VKLKLEPGVLPDLAPFAGRIVSADANGTLGPSSFAALAGLGLDHVEQPLSADDLAAHADLRRAVPTLPIALDESIRTVTDVERVAAAGAADIVVLKPGRLGGLRAARAAHDAAVAAGLGCKVGGMWDTGIGRAAALAVASLPGCSVAPDLSAADRYWQHDVVADPAALDADGRLAVPAGPGLGVDVAL
jgi:O-succinylbenzoate synthase